MSPLIEQIAKEIAEQFLKNKELQAKLIEAIAKALQGGNVATVPVVPTPVIRPAEPAVVLESWFEEFWHDWFKGSLPNEPDSDWAPDGSPKHEAIVNGEEYTPGGTVIRFMTGIHQPDGKPAIVPGDYNIMHMFGFQPDAGDVKQLFELPTNTPEGSQPIPGFGHVQYSIRDWGVGTDNKGRKRPAGWAITVRLNKELPRGRVFYQAVPLNGEAGASPEVSIGLLGGGNA